MGSAYRRPLGQCDAACRGAEPVVLLPDCRLSDTAAKAEARRARIESLPELHSARVTASFGVAAFPKTSAAITDILARADSALYRTKQSG